MKNLKTLAIENDQVLDAINTSDIKTILFNVENVATTDLLTDCSANSEYSRMIFGYIDGKKTLLNCCSNRYELVHNSEIFPSVIYLLITNNIKFKTKTEISENKAEFTIKFIFEDHQINVGQGDVIFPQITITHSYNGKLKYGIIFGYYRLICSNGLVVPVKEASKFNLNIKGKHTTSILKSFELLITNLNIFMEEKDNYVKGFNAIHAKKINMVELDARILNIMDLADIKNPANKAFEYVKSTILDEMAKLNETTPNDWLIYNAFNAYTFNENKKNFEVRNTIDTDVFNIISEMAV